MRATFFGVLIVFVTANWAESQDSKKGNGAPQPTHAVYPDFSYFEKSLGLCLKSFDIEVSKQKIIRHGKQFQELQGRITYVLEFDRDAQKYNFNELQKAFVDPKKKVEHLFFDKDNIAMNVNVNYQVEGVVSGLRGESFRVNVEFGSDGSVMWGGVRLGRINEKVQKDLKMEFGIPEEAGLVVIAVAPNSAGDKAGLKPGDLLLKINAKEVPNDPDGYESFANLVKEAKGDESTHLFVFRNFRFEAIEGAKMPTIAQATPIAIIQQAQKLVVRPRE
jgi:PDZ domain